MPYVHVYALSVHCVHVGYACDVPMCVRVEVVVHGTGTDQHPHFNVLSYSVNSLSACAVCGMLSAVYSTAVYSYIVPCNSL